MAAGSRKYLRTLSTGREGCLSDRRCSGGGGEKNGGKEEEREEEKQEEKEKGDRDYEAAKLNPRRYGEIER